MIEQHKVKILINLHQHLKRILIVHSSKRFKCGSMIKYLAGGACAADKSITKGTQVL